MSLSLDQPPVTGNIQSDKVIFLKKFKFDLRYEPFVLHNKVNEVRNAFFHRRSLLHSQDIVIICLLLLYQPLYRNGMGLQNVQG